MDTRNDISVSSTTLRNPTPRNLEEKRDGKYLMTEDSCNVNGDISGYFNKLLSTGELYGNSRVMGTLYDQIFVQRVRYNCVTYRPKKGTESRCIVRDTFKRIGTGLVGS